MTDAGANAWFVAETQSRQERVAEAHLRRQGFETFLPQFRCLRRHARRTEMVSRPLFPGYVFVGLDPAQSRWRSVNGTVGCRRLVAFGDQPLPLPMRVLEALRGRQDAEGFIHMEDPLDKLPQGAPLRVTQGPFADLVGLFQTRDDAMRVILLLDLLGRPTRVTLPAHSVAAA
ncbi:transcription termination/antitermination NusG family protein [Ferrovibrio sp.]|uniref:transcription termination/antitermination protein NusG n=1 Tax=Ferrovibrio sp. TaxID=1917215 RepID=UPI0025BAB61D|nr:transcription termination/antitermination NusG family protein [Ferrovibrio sp.]MBX3454610.1 hypothetical protein [Ferrovibrio sp.]